MDSRPVFIFGHIGSDAGYWYLGTDGKIHHVPGWNPETRQAFATIEKNLAILEKGARHEGGIPQSPGNIAGAGGLEQKADFSEQA